MTLSGGRRKTPPGTSGSDTSGLGDDMLNVDEVCEMEIERSRNDEIVSLKCGGQDGITQEKNWVCDGESNSRI